MIGFNFFSDHGQKKQKMSMPVKGSRMIFLVAAVLLLFFGGTIYYLVQVIQIDGEIKRTQAFLSDERIQTAIRKDNELKNKQQVLIRYGEALQNLEEQKEKSDKIETEALLAILNEISGDVTVSQLSILNKTASLSGTALESERVTKLVNGLKQQQSYLFSEVFLSNITWNERGYSFLIELKFH